jgi:hypothetical protein
MPNRITLFKKAMWCDSSPTPQRHANADPTPRYVQNLPYNIFTPQHELLVFLQKFLRFIDFRCEIWASSTIRVI